MYLAGIPQVEGHINPFLFFPASSGVLVPRNVEEINQLSQHKIVTWAAVDAMVKWSKTSP